MTVEEGHVNEAYRQLRLELYEPIGDNLETYQHAIAPLLDSRRELRRNPQLKGLLRVTDPSRGHERVAFKTERIEEVIREMVSENGMDAILKGPPLLQLTAQAVETIQIQEALGQILSGETRQPQELARQVRLRSRFLSRLLDTEQGLGEVTDKSFLAKHKNLLEQVDTQLQTIEKGIEISPFTPGMQPDVDVIEGEAHQVE